MKNKKDELNCRIADYYNSHMHYSRISVRVISLLLSLIISILIFKNFSFFIASVLVIYITVYLMIIFL